MLASVYSFSGAIGCASVEKAVWRRTQHGLSSKKMALIIWYNMLIVRQMALITSGCVHFRPRRGGRRGRAVRGRRARWTSDVGGVWCGWRVVWMARRRPLTQGPQYSVCSRDQSGQVGGGAVPLVNRIRRRGHTRPRRGRKGIRQPRKNNGHENTKV